MKTKACLSVLIVSMFILSSVCILAPNVEAGGGTEVETLTVKPDSVTAGDAWTGHYQYNTESKARILTIDGGQYDFSGKVGIVIDGNFGDDGSLSIEIGSKTHLSNVVFTGGEGFTAINTTVGAKLGELYINSLKTFNVIASGEGEFINVSSNVVIASNIDVNCPITSSGNVTVKDGNVTITSAMKKIQYGISAKSIEFSGGAISITSPSNCVPDGSVNVGTYTYLHRTDGSAMTAKSLFATDPTVCLTSSDGAKWTKDSTGAHIKAGKASATFNFGDVTGGSATFKDKIQEDAIVAGETVIIVATPATNYIFDHWNEVTTMTDNPLSVKAVPGTNTYIPVFVEDTGPHAIYYDFDNQTTKVGEEAFKEGKVTGSGITGIPESHAVAGCYTDKGGSKSWIFTEDTYTGKDNLSIYVKFAAVDKNGKVNANTNCDEIEVFGSKNILVVDVTFGGKGAMGMSITLNGGEESQFIYAKMTQDSKNSEEYFEIAANDMQQIPATLSVNVKLPCVYSNNPIVYQTISGADKELDELEHTSDSITVKVSSLGKDGQAHLKLKYGSTPSTDCKVYFLDESGQEVAKSISVKSGTTITEPKLAEPLAENQVITGWYNNNVLWIFGTGGTQVSDKNTVLVMKVTTVQADKSIMVDATGSGNAVDVELDGKVTKVSVKFTDGAVSVDNLPATDKDLIVKLTKQTTGEKYDVSVLLNGVEYTGQTITIQLPYDTTKSEPTLYYYKSATEKVKMDATFNGSTGIATFTTTHNSTYGIEYAEEPQPTVTTSNDYGPLIMFGVFFLFAFTVIGLAIKRD